jgi:hypothetical protein
MRGFSSEPNEFWRDSLAELQDLANGTDTVTFADGSSLSLGGQTWDQLSVDDVFFIV